MRKKLAKVEAANAKYTAEKEERERTEKEAKEKKRKAAQDRANALLDTVTQLWDSQVDDALWADEESRKQQKENFKKMIETQPEISRDILKIAHCASARYAEVMNSDAQRQRDLTSRLGHVMKKRKTVHAASARSVEHGESASAAASSSSSSASSSAPQKKTLMQIMKGYSGSSGVSGTATSIMQRLYKSHMDRQAPF